MVEALFREVGAMVALALEAMVVLIIAAAAIKAFARTVPLLFHDELLAHERHAIWLRFATAILLALEFTLASDIIRSAITPSWDAIGKLGAVAAIRIALNFFLARDIEALGAITARGPHRKANED